MSHNSSRAGNFFRRPFHRSSTISTSPSDLSMLCRCQQVEKLRVKSCFLYLCHCPLTDYSGCYREPDIRLIIEMALRVACTDRLRQLEASSVSPVRSYGQTESQRMENDFDASEFRIAALWASYRDSRLSFAFSASCATPPCASATFCKCHQK